MYTLAIFSLVSTALFYLGSRALITSPLWSRYPSWLASLTDCAACIGFWWGVLLAGTIGRSLGMSYLGLDPLSWWSVPIVGLCSLVMTPIVAGLMQRGLDHVGYVQTSAIGPPIEPEKEWTELP